MMIRQELNGYLSQTGKQRFRYGAFDCALFAARWVQRVTGKDLTLGIEYSSRRDGRDKLRSAGLSDHVEAAASQLDEIPVARAMAGDIAAIPVGGAGFGLGIVAGERVAVLTRSTGVGFVPLTDAVRAFRVEVI